MDPIDYDQIARDATAMLGIAGARVRLVKKGVTGDYVPGQPVTWEDLVYDGTGAVFDVETADMDDSRVQATDSKLYMAVDTIDGSPMPEPVPDDTIDAFSTLWNVIKCDSLKPAGIPCLYTVILRGTPQGGA